jgi:hypothetical protein
LRLNNGKIQTSKGVFVDPRIVKALYCSWLSGKDIVGRHVENYTIRSVNENECTIGCNIIPMTEEKNIVEQL